MLPSGSVKFLGSVEKTGSTKPSDKMLLPGSAERAAILVLRGSTIPSSGSLIDSGSVGTPPGRTIPSGRKISPGSESCLLRRGRPIGESPGRM